MSIDALALPNVRIAESIKTARPPQQYTYTLDGHKEFREVLTHAISANPHWDFEFVSGKRVGIEDPQNPGRFMFRLTKAKVSLGKEYLGDIGIEYHGSSEKVYVLNHRLAAVRSRNQGKAFTSSTQRAITLINKSFSRRTPTELMRDAKALVFSGLNELNSARYFKVREAAVDMNKWASQFVMDNFEQLKPMLAGLANGSQLTEGMATFKQATEAAEEIKMLKNVTDEGGNTTVVVLHGSYVVHSGDTLSTFTHDTLPDALRGPLGMLKLVEPNTLLPVGVRINDEVFLIRVNLTAEGEKDAAQV